MLCCLLCRRVVNPLEDGDVVGIVNYVDVGLRLVTPLAIDPEAGAAATHTPSSPTAGGLGGSKVTRGSAPGEQGSEAPGVVLGASWQVCVDGAWVCACTVACIGLQSASMV